MLTVLYCPKCGRQMFRLSQRRVCSTKDGYSFETGKENPSEIEYTLGCRVWYHRLFSALEGWRFNEREGQCYRRNAWYGMSGGM